MPSAANLAWDALLELREGSGPLHVRLTNAVRGAIREGRLPAGSALPPSRHLASELHCSRWTVTEAYEQLIAEGYLEAKVGSATRVRSRELRRVGSSVGRAVPAPSPRFDLRPGRPDIHAFPRGPWVRAMREIVAELGPAELAYPPPGGNYRLRQVLADYLHRVRGADVDADNLTITSGILDGITQVTRALAADGHSAIAVENPSWTRVFKAISQTGLKLAPLEVDAEGMMVDGLRSRRVRAAMVAPAHQFPTGRILSPARRAALLEWAREVDGLVLEDDYDAEFRYDRRPIGALQGNEPNHVALFGSLSKTLTPALGLGWCITPQRWTEVLRSNEQRMTGPSTLEQLTLARFIESGGHDRHLRSVRRRYRSRRDRLTAALARALPDCTILGAAAGLHFVLELPRGVHAQTVVDAAAERSLRVWDMDLFWFEAQGVRPKRLDNRLVIGYGSLSDELVEEAVHTLADSIRASSPALLKAL